jgi:hypothetical protein
MSIVAVHGPNMWGGTGAGGGGTGMVVISPTGVYKATADPTNGLRFTFEAIQKGRPAIDYDWTFPGGTPASQADSQGPIVVTFATAGSKTISLAIAAGAGTPATGTYPMTVEAVSGPRAVLEEGEEPPPEGQQAEIQEEMGPDSDPGDFTVAEVIEYVGQHPEEAQRLYDAEVAGKARVTLVSHLEGLLAS